jgi:hypothetical protein
MSGHGGFPISRRTAERLLEGAARPNPLSSVLTLSNINPPPPKLHGVCNDEKTSTAPSMKGFKYLFPLRPKSDDALTPEQKAALETALRKTTSRLARRVEIAYDWPEHLEPDPVYSDLEKWENPYIPSGYTYLLQIVAHDLVATSFPISILEQTTTGARNTRSAALRLDTVYGGGPLVCPLSYRKHAPTDSNRTALRFGRTKGSAANLEEMRDIPRMSAPGASGTAQALLTEVAIPDPRNDDNPIISQMVVIFHLLHETVLDILREKTGATAGDEAEMRRFLCARGAVTLIYRNIIRRDLLARLLHPSVYNYYQTDSMSGPSSPAFRFLDETAASPDGDARISLEFSHAAFRFGHAMVRPSYRFNEFHAEDFPLPFVLRRSSSKHPHEFPLDKDWIISWSYFFKFPEDDHPAEQRRPRLTFSRRIGPDFNGGMVSAEHFPPIDEVTENKAGLAYRDFLAGGFLDLPSIDDIVDTIERKNMALAGAVNLRRVADYREKLSDYLGSRTAGSGLQPAEIESLVKDPPLAFFILFEAAVEPEAPGLRLGPLGSIIVADVILAAMARDPVTGEDKAQSLSDALRELSKTIYEGTNSYLEDLDDINSMVDLIRFVAARREFGSENPNFI